MSLVFLNNSVCQHIVQCTECEARGSSSIGGNKQLQYKRWSLVCIYITYITYIHTIIQNTPIIIHWLAMRCNSLPMSEVFLWSLALLFLGLVCMPGMPLWVVIPSIVLMQSLNSCTKAFNRAQLINFLPREKIATYMTSPQLHGDAICHHPPGSTEESSHISA